MERKDPLFQYFKCRGQTTGPQPCCLLEEMNIELTEVFQSDKRCASNGNASSLDDVNTSVRTPCSHRGDAGSSPTPLKR